MKIKVEIEVQQKCLAAGDTKIVCALAASMTPSVLWCRASKTPLEQCKAEVP